MYVLFIPESLPHIGDSRRVEASYGTDTHHVCYPAGHKGAFPVPAVVPSVNPSFLTAPSAAWYTYIFYTGMFEPLSVRRALKSALDSLRITTKSNMWLAQCAPLLLPRYHMQ